jgi:hypothetical protein
MTPGLQKYLEFERLMLILDEDGDPAAEILRDAMDPIWFSLTDEERRLLDDRQIGRITSLVEFRIPVGSQVFREPPPPPEPKSLPKEPIRGWAVAA